MLVWFAISMPLFADSIVSQRHLEEMQRQYGAAAYQRGLELQQTLAAIVDVSEREKLERVNNFFNQFTYVGDMENWQQRDYWATPEEFIGRMRGDCEDYVIAKYFALREVGVAESKLFLTYVQATELNVAHMVLTYFETPQSTPLVLDNYDSRVLPASDRKDLLPVYSFNARSFFLADASAGLGTRVPTNKIKNSKWTTLLKSLEDGDK
jgi:predicted transglutaminase-like cysteine proteinase